MDQQTTPQAKPLEKTLDDIYQEIYTEIDKLPLSQTAYLKKLFERLQFYNKRKLRQIKNESDTPINNSINNSVLHILKTPQTMSDELCKFLNYPVGAKLSRSEITRKFFAYIKENNLQNPTNKKNFIPDDKIKTLFKLSSNTELKLFALQKYIKSHLNVSENNKKMIKIYDKLITIDDEDIIPKQANDDICNFMGKPSGTLLSAKEVIYELFKYGEECNLQHPENKNLICLDEKIEKVLSIKKEMHYVTLADIIRKRFKKLPSG